MSSILIITHVESLQHEIQMVACSLQDLPGVYISLNKTQRSTETSLKEAGSHCRNLFFIDCVTQDKTRDDVLHIAPDKLDLLAAAVKEFILDIKGQKYIMIDAISTLLIYNNSAKVAQFVKEITELSSRTDTNLIAFSPKTKGEELLNMIFNFFDKVEER